MPTVKKTLNRTPQKISDGNFPAYMQSMGGLVRFAFSEAQPTDLTTYHQDMQIYTDGSLGAMWAWSAHFDEVIVAIST